MRVLAAAALLLALQQAEAQRPFRSGVQTVAVYVTVNDSQGRTVPELTRDDFRVLDNGRPVDIATFSSDPQPLTVALMLDMSASMSGRFLLVREATASFVDALLPSDRAQIGTFGTEVAVSPLLTNDKRALKRVLDEEVWPGGGTPLWNAIDTAMNALAPADGRRVILVITDGSDSISLPGMRRGFANVERRARNEGFMVFAVGMEATGLSREIVDLTTQSGGGHFELSHDADLTQAFARVTASLRNQYMIGFVPAALDGKLHTLEVRMMRPGLTARGRATYLAVAPR